MKREMMEKASLLRELARASYFARTSADIDEMNERLDYVETELLQVADWLLDLEESLTEVEE